MRSQIPRENQGPSVQIGSDFAQDQVGASGMLSRTIRGDYRHLNPLPGRGGETSDSSESDLREGLDYLRRLHAQAQAQQEDSAAPISAEGKHERIRVLLENGCKGETE